MDEQKIKEIIEQYGTGIESFEIKSVDNDKKIVEVDAQYKFPLVRLLTNPFTAENMLVVYDKDEKGEITSTVINLRSKDNLAEAREKHIYHINNK